MTNSLKKQLLAGEHWRMKAIEILNALSFKRTCCMLTLRQGTMLIAVAELSVTAFIMFLLLLGVTHTQDMVTLVSSELERLEEVDSRFRNFDDALFFFNNERRMLKGQHLASLMMIVVFTGLVFATVHVISCLMLLIGAIRKIPFLLLPWASTVLFTAISSFFFLLMFAFLPLEDDCKNSVYVTFTVLMMFEFYAWLVVVNFYRELQT